MLCLSIQQGYVKLIKSHSKNLLLFEICNFLILKKVKKILGILTIDYNQHIRIIFLKIMWHWSNDAENTASTSQKKTTLKYIKIKQL